jgi:hypothetical protein
MRSEFLELNARGLREEKKKGINPKNSPDDLLPDQKLLLLQLLVSLRGKNQGRSGLAGPVGDEIFDEWTRLVQFFASIAFLPSLLYALLSFAILFLLTRCICAR